MLAGSMPPMEATQPSWRAHWSVGSSAVLVALFTAYRVVAAYPSFAGLNFASGVWIAMANDAMAGIWYRPLLGEHGYGGGVYFPLYFSAHALLMHLGMPVVAAGRGLSLASAVLLGVALYWLARHLDLSRMLSTAVVSLAFCSISVQFAVTTIRGDLLAAALVVLGLASLPSPFLAAAAFVLAGTTKITALFGAAVAVAILLLERRFRRALQLGAAVAAGMLVVALAMEALSGGTFIQVQLGGAGLTLSSLLSAPIEWFRRVQEDLVTTFLVLLSCGLLLGYRKAWRELPGVWLVGAGLASVFIFAHPGADFNHLIDVHVALALFVVFQVARGRVPGRLAAGCLVAVVALGVAYLGWHFTSDRTVSAAVYEEAWQLIDSRDDRPVFYSDPILPALQGQRPYLLDPFIFLMSQAESVDLADDLRQRIERQFFGAVVMHWDMTTRGGAERARRYFGPAFPDAVASRYRPAERVGDFWVWRPRSP